MDKTEKLNTKKEAERANAAERELQSKELSSKESISKLESEVSRLKKEADRANAAERELQSKDSSSKESISKLESEVSDLKKTLEETNEANKKKFLQLDSEKSELEEEKSELKKQIRAMAQYLELDSSSLMKTPSASIKKFMEDSGVIKFTSPSTTPVRSSVAFSPSSGGGFLTPQKESSEQLLEESRRRLQESESIAEKVKNENTRFTTIDTSLYNNSNSFKNYGGVMVQIMSQDEIDKTRKSRATNISKSADDLIMVKVLGTGRGIGKGINGAIIYVTGDMLKSEEEIVKEIRSKHPSGVRRAQGESLLSDSEISEIVRKGSFHFEGGNRLVGTFYQSNPDGMSFVF